MANDYIHQHGRGKALFFRTKPGHPGKHAHRPAALVWTLSLIVFFVASCASHTSVFYSLTNQGIVPVSSDNPHVGTNLFLAREMEASSYLYSFMKKRGAPQAIELTGTDEKSAELRMFYADKQEGFTATPQFNRQTKTKEWIVRGPYGLDRENYHTLANLRDQRGGAFEIFGRLEVLGGPARAESSRVLAPAFVPTPRPTPRPIRRVKKTDAPANGPVTDSTLPFSGSPSNLDQEALIEALRQKAPTPPPPIASPVQSPVQAPNPAIAAPKTSAPLNDAAASSTVKGPEAKPTSVSQPTKPGSK
jgi:hypothetical protein